MFTTIRTSQSKCLSRSFIANASWMVLNEELVTPCFHFNKAANLNSFPWNAGELNCASTSFQSFTSNPRITNNCRQSSISRLDASLRRCLSDGDCSSSNLPKPTQIKSYVDSVFTFTNKMYVHILNESVNWNYKDYERRFL